MRWLNKLPGYQRTPYGFEWRLLKRLPLLMLVGTVLPAASAWLARWVLVSDGAMDMPRSLQTFEFALMGLIVFVWISGVTIGIGCIIVWLMKGPAYVADGYEVSHSDKPRV